MGFFIGEPLFTVFGKSAPCEHELSTPRCSIYDYKYYQECTKCKFFFEVRRPD